MDEEVTTRIMNHRDTQSTEAVERQRSRSESRVFPAGPRADRYFASEAAEHARSALVRCVERMEGPALLIGPSGTGKSLMLLVLAESFRFRLNVATLPGGQLRTPRELHQGILYSLGLPFRGLDEGELRLSLVQRLEADEDAQEGVLLLVDEAQSLRIELMEELRMLTNIVREGASQVRLVLAGTPVLEEQLADPQLESFHQRIAVRCYLQKLTRSETNSYIQAHISAARRDVNLFTPEAVEAIHETSEGLPRLINQVCDHSLLLAEAAGRGSVDAEIVHQAWGDLQHLPTGNPSNLATHPRDDAEQESVIEFGAWQDPVDSRQPVDAGHEAFYEEDLDDTPHDFGRGFGIIHGDPEERIDAIAEQIAAIRDDDSPPEQNEQFTPDVSEIDFSLPDDEWPEVEVVVRDTRRGGAAGFKEEEVISDPFPGTLGQRSGWSVQTEVAFGGRSTPFRLKSEPQSVAVDAEPLSSVPLMIQVQTELYTPDSVLPEAAGSEIAVALPAGARRDDQACLQNPPPSPVGQPQRREQKGPHAADVPSTIRRPAVSRPATKRFATLFTSLQD